MHFLAMNPGGKCGSTHHREEFVPETAAWPISRLRFSQSIRECLYLKCFKYSPTRSTPWFLPYTLIGFQSKELLKKQPWRVPVIRETAERPGLCLQFLTAGGLQKDSPLEKSRGCGRILEPDIEFHQRFKHFTVLCSRDKQPAVRHSVHGSLIQLAVQALDYLQIQDTPVLCDNA